MKLVFGLGNPGPAYVHTRHNVGFMVVDRLASLLEAGSEKKQGQSLVRAASLSDAHIRLLLVKPQTYMNLSGNALWELLSFYKDMVEDFIVVHDDLDLPLDKIRYKSGGGAGGHRGVKSISECLRSEDYDRLKIGIGRPPGQMKAEAFVLQAFSFDEKPVLDKVLELAAQSLKDWLADGCDQAMRKYNAAELSIKDG